jgi:adsorption protein B
MFLVEFIMSVMQTARNELLLFAAVGLLLGGVDDLAFDSIYGCRHVWRRFTIYRRHPRMTADALPAPHRPGTMAVLIPAWDEAAVIGAMLGHCLRQWRADDVHVFVGVYPNDRATLEAVAGVAQGSDRVTIVVNGQPGPTTKADCLNSLWHALRRWEAQRGGRAKAIVLHDAEDVVHADALRVMSAMIDRFALVQLPVLPLATRRSRWISGHYCDEFAEAHAKALMVREAIGAALPSAGVGCAIARDTMEALSMARDGHPFDPGSLTEDYEIGLRIGELGGRGVIVRMRDAHGELVATQEYFPDTIRGAVQQKARWTLGIALAGWDRLGWGGSLAEAWMRVRDRRALVAALVLLAAYGGAVLTGLLWIGAGLGLASLSALPDPLPVLLLFNAMLLGWRMVMRALFVHRAYGPAEALRSIPRVFVANIIAMMAARRALAMYVRLWRGGAVQWDKTSHRFPGLAEAPS